jgi:tetratricopeptide (TPR) repeat protein
MHGRSGIRNGVRLGNRGRKGFPATWPGRSLNYRGQWGIPLLQLAVRVIFLGLAIMAQPAASQTFTEIDIKTYQLYLEQNWDELIREGRSALKQDVDYYYLRMRIGIAFYEQKNYKSAQSHFKKALEFSDGDVAALEYLYYAYLFGGQTQQASLLYEDMPASLKEKLPSPGQKIVDRISGEYLYNQTFTDDLVNDPATFDGLPLGLQIVTRYYQNLNVSLQHFMHPGTSFIHAYTYLGKSSYYYYDDGVNRFGTEGQQINQHQYYLSPSFTFRGGLVVSPAFHFLHVGYQVPDLSGGGPGPGGSNKIAFREESESQLVGGLALAKFQGPFNFRLGAVYSNLNRKNQLTGSAGMTWYPLGNIDLYLSASLYAHVADLGATGVNEGATDGGAAGEEASNERGLAIIPDLLFGWGIASKVWIEISGTYGDMRNFTESNGYIVYNGLDWMKYMALANLAVPLTKKGSVIYAGARFAGYENRFIPMDQSQPSTLNNLTYNSLSIFGGISWKF